MDICENGTLNQLFMRDSRDLYESFKKNKVICGKTTFSVIGPFCTSLHFHMKMLRFQS